MDVGRHKVLIVEDERMIADTFAEIFSRVGYETRTAYTAEQSIEIMAEWLPDLAIIDVVLPQMNGIDLAILLRTRCPACRLMLLSGDEITSDLLDEAAKKGYKFDILAKPVHPTVVLESALNLLAANQSKPTEETVASEQTPPGGADPPPIE